MSKMTTDELKKTARRMLWIIPGMLLCMIGDYCMFFTFYLSTRDINTIVSTFPVCKGKWDRRFLKLYITGLILGVMCFLYFHLECGTLIHNFNVLYEAAGGNTELAVEMWNRSYMVQAVPYWVTFFSFELAVLVGWTALILRGTFSLKKTWVLASPLIIAGIGYLMEILIPWPFNGFVSGFESFGWIVLFLGGRKLVLQAVQDCMEGAI